ncbi:hypothetical protein B6D12_12320 [Gilliamella apicola]|uniref:Aca2/YdiL-like domain-containing protein n=1 Tax=Gilliamella TaxID=1193503 RepID=UPI000810B1E8|nr:DUF1870 family protein [Gilliamella apicola]OCF93201.1 hypothetical protein A9G17_08745 [Gilliamella apicola]OTP90387.1 hypothetical protein B5S41_04105 [Gilliamella apicola]OTP94446.1 hypothetical protein B6D13_07080 [Gilliamella apicola]OTP96607.1 hypothetical protein B6D05_04605 [Gilliamella apicola]OTQ02211.1 hypothetical protein B6D07_06535 [Gilliamella apicola]
MTNLELQAYRRFLMLKVSEASEYIGKTDVSTWHNWEKGTVPVPQYVVTAMQELKKFRTDKVNIIINSINDRVGSNTIRYFMTYEEFKKVNPELDIIQWRLHQSIATELYFRGLEKLC